MKVNWDTLTHPVWDAHHATAAAPLQQDWAYGSTAVSLGALVLRARVHADGVPVAMAQFIVRRFGRWAGFALCSRGPIWLQNLRGANKAQATRTAMP